MVKPDQQRRTIILDAAFAEFAENGFPGATIKSIAAAAELQSPALIYWYFPDKEALFDAVIQSRMPVLRGSAGGSTPLLDAPPGEVLPLLARSYLAAFGGPDQRRFTRLVIGESGRRPELARAFGDRFLARVVEFLGRYLDRQVALGRLRPHDSRIGAHAFVGMLVSRIVGGLFTQDSSDDEPAAEGYVAGVVEIFLAGLGPDAPPDTDDKGVQSR